MIEEIIIFEVFLSGFGVDSKTVDKEKIANQSKKTKTDFQPIPSGIQRRRDRHFQRIPEK